MGDYFWDIGNAKITAYLMNILIFPLNMYYDCYIVYQRFLGFNCYHFCYKKARSSMHAISHNFLQ